MRYPDYFLKLIQVLKKLPGVGSKSAERFAFHLLDWSDHQLNELGNTIKGIRQHLTYCPECGCLVGSTACGLCDLTKRDTDTLCIISSARDVFSIEETHEYRGLYHVLGGVLSPLDKKGPEHLRIPQLKKRLQDLPIKEIVIALDSTLEGDATSLYLKQELASYPQQISRLAFGLPMGSSLDYVDGGTLARALAGRNLF